MNANNDIIIKDILVIARKNENADFSYTCNKRVGAGYIVIMSGSGTFSCEDYVRELKPNDVIILDKHDKYKIDAGENGLGYLTTAFTLSSKHTFRAFSLPYCISIPSSINIATSLQQEWEKRDQCYLIKVRKILYEILIDAIRIVKNNQKRQDSYAKIYPAVEFINQNFKQEINYEKLADMCLFSPSHFRKIFVREMKMPPTVYREAVRCEVAKGMLISDIFTVSEIAEELGYCDIYHFSKEFKKRVGVSPTAFKKSYFDK